MADRETEILQKLALAQKALRAQQIRHAFNPGDMDSLPTAEQQRAFTEQAACTTQVISGGNQSGKSAYGCRTAAWFFERNHPYINIDELWPDEPLRILVLSREGRQYQEHWEQRIRPFLASGTYHEQKSGGVLNTVRHRKNGGKILFFSYENPAQAAERIQSFTGHLVWIDELCDYLPLYEEAERRIQARDGKMLITFTPKKPAPAIKRYLETPTAYKRSYVFSTFDNPVYSVEQKQKIIASISQMPASQREAHLKNIIYGAWKEAESSVYNYDPEVHSAFPPGYHGGWRHMESVDPAASGKVGLIIGAEDPNSGRWYIVKAKYLAGEAATDLLDKLAIETRGLNITHRTFDTNAAWFAKEAMKRGIYYAPVMKAHQKEELIKGVSEALKAGWLKLLPDACELLVDELSSARWSATKPGAIVGTTHYHLLDALQYFVQSRPRYAGAVAAADPLVHLDLANRARKKKEAARATLAKSRRSRLRPAFGRA